MTELTQQRKEYVEWRNDEWPDTEDGSQNDVILYYGWQGGRSSLESENARLREALRLALDELHEVNLANSYGNKPRNPEMTVFAEAHVRDVLEPRGAIRGGTNGQTP